jgi:aryl-alcohol dehydrogenase-like predicted oxidoreductase
MAQEKGVSAAQLALAWLLTRGEHVVPIPGSRRIERLEENAAAADIELAAGGLERLDEILPVGVAAGMRYPEGRIRGVNV